jgi:riboflavin biosynthesis pyrimidine reductase
MLRVHPGPPLELSVADAYDDPRRREVAVARQRPWVQLCMVASIDGATDIDGRSQAIGGPTDGEVMRHLRRSADVVLVGAGTVRAEHYRVRPGVRIAVVSRSLDVDWSWPLWSDVGTTVITTTDAPVAPREVRVLRCGTGSVDLADAVRALGDDPTTDVIQCEGGPTLNAAMMAADCLDEICLTIGARTVAGSSLRVAHGLDHVNHRYTLEQVAIADDDLFLRYLRAPHLIPIDE